jgi:hypothetical protein
MDRKSIWVIAFLILLQFSAAAAETGFRNFITRSGDRLMDGQNEYRFISYNIPCLHYNEDAMAFAETSPWRLPDAYEIEDALESVRQMGGQAVRTYTLSVLKRDDTDGVPRHVLGPGQFSEQAFRVLDRVLEIANQKGVRLIIPFVDNWSWWGGTAEYAAFRGKTQDAFWTDPQIIDDFKRTIRYVLLRKNTLTGITYKDDKAVLAWETGNELHCPHPWTREITAYIKTLDSRHLVMDGFHATLVRRESIDDPDVDVVTSHHYPKNARQMIDQVLDNCGRAEGKKPYVVGEFGFIPTDGIAALLDTVIRRGISGALIWSLRTHNRDGGFYWHTEPHGRDFYKAYHWPGFSSGDAYDETAVVGLMRRKAFEIRNVPLPPLDIPAPPRLLPIHAPSSIAWQGSAGASGYDVDRSEKREGPWLTVAESVSDAEDAYRSLFDDRTAEIGKSVYYRVRAKNQAGVSKPSNVVGPVKVRSLCIVDGMKDFTRMESHNGELTPVSNEARKAKEDFHRIRGEKGSILIYRLPGVVRSWSVDAFFPDDIRDFTFTVSVDGSRFIPALAERNEFFKGKKEYGYWKPVGYSGSSPLKGARVLKIEFNGNAQIAEIEVQYGK